MKYLKIIAIVILASAVFCPTASADLVHRFWVASSRNGGGSGSLDGGISGVTPNVWDSFMVSHSDSGVTVVEFFRVSMDGAAESLPFIVRSDTVGAGNTSYYLQAIGASAFWVRPMSNPTVTDDGLVAYSTNVNGLVSGDGTNTRVLALSGHTVFVMISSPGSLADTNQQPIWVNDTGAAFVVTNAKFRTNESGVTIEGLVYSTSETNYTFGSGTTIFNFIPMDTSGTTIHQSAFTGGTTSIPNGRAVLMDFGEASPDWISITLGGYLQGNK